VRSEKSVTNEHLDLLRNRWRDNIIRLLVSVKKDENNQHDAYQGLHELFEIIKQDSQKEVGVLGEEYEKQVVKQPEPEVRLKAASKKEVAQEEMAEDVEFDPEAVTNMLTAAMTVKAYLIDHPQVRTDEIRAHLGKILEETGVVLTDEQWEQMSKYIPKQAEEISKKEKKGVVYSSVRETEFEVKKEKEADDLEGPKVPKEVIESGRYEGNTNKEGMPDGVGTISYPDSPEIEMVEAKFVGGVLPEEGKIVYTDGSYYEGDIRFLENNVDHPRRWGQGTWFDEDGEELDVGRWRNDELLEVAEPTFDERFEKKDQAGIVERAKEIFANLPDPFKEVAAGDTDFDFGKKEAAMKPRIDELQAELLRAYGTESSKELEETLQQIIDHLLENNQVIAAKLVKVNLSAGRSINLELKPELLIQARDHLAEAGQTTDPSADQYKHGMTDYRRATMLLGKYVEEEKSEAGGEEKGEEKDKSNYISDIRSEVEQFLASDPLPPRWKLKVSVVLDEAKKQGIEISPEDLQPLKLLFQNVYEAFLRTTEDGIVDKTGLDKDITKWLGKEPELNEDSHKELDRMRTRELSAPGSPLPTIEWIEEYAEKKGKPLEKIDIVTAQATFDRLVGTGETEWMKAFENFVERRVDGSLSFNEAVFKDAFYKATGDGEDVSYSAKLSSLVFYAIEKKVFPFVDIDSALNKATTTYVAEIADKVFKGELSLEQIKKGER